MPENEMTIVKVGRRGTLVIPARERRRAGIEEGDHVDVVSEGPGIIIMRRIPSLKEIQERFKGRLPQWSDLEGLADQLLNEELRR